jgi:uncharacterized YccA/Bax inhibitor family protein
MPSINEGVRVTNPILAKSEAFSARSGNYSGYTAWDPATGQTSTEPYGYAPPGQPATGQPGFAPSGFAPSGFTPAGSQQPPTGPGWAQPTWQAPPVPTSQRVMTLDDVLTKTALTLGTTVIIAVLAGWATITLNLPLQSLWVVGIVCGLATIIFPFVAAARRKVGPGIAIPFAILEGVFIGAISLLFEMVYPGIVIQAVVATFVAAGLTLAAFKFGKFRLSGRMRKIVMMSMFAYVGVALLNLVLFLFGINLGLFPGPTGSVSWLAWLAAGLGVVLAVLSLVDDFQFIEQGIANRVPAQESWRAAYGLTVTLVWLYVNLLRILSYIRR